MKAIVQDQFSDADELAPGDEVMGISGEPRRNGNDPEGGP